MQSKVISEWDNKSERKKEKEGRCNRALCNQEYSWLILAIPILNFLLWDIGRDMSQPLKSDYSTGMVIDIHEKSLRCLFSSMSNSVILYMHADETGDDCELMVRYVVSEKELLQLCFCYNCRVEWRRKSQTLHHGKSLFWKCFLLLKGNIIFIISPLI